MLGFLPCSFPRLISSCPPPFPGRLPAPRLDRHGDRSAVAPAYEDPYPIAHESEYSTRDSPALSRRPSRLEEARRDPELVNQLQSMRIAMEESNEMHASEMEELGALVYAVMVRPTVVAGDLVV